jgi:hypothetical protein
MRLVSRREAAFLPVLLPGLRAVGRAAESPAKRVVIVHDEEAPMRALTAELERAHAMKVALVDQTQWSGERLKGVGAVIMYVHKPILPVLERDLLNYVETGGRLVVLHHGIASAKNANPRWLALAGIRMLPRDHPTQPWKVLRGTYRLVNLRPRHYVTTRGVRYRSEIRYTPSDSPAAEQTLSALEFPDTEIFLNQGSTDGREKTILFGFQTEVDGKTYMQDRGGWLKKAGSGYLLYFQPGHLASDFTPDYVQIIANAINWDGRE